MCKCFQGQDAVLCLVLRVLNSLYCAGDDFVSAVSISGLPKHARALAGYAIIPFV